MSAAMAEHEPLSLAAPGPRSGALDGVLLAAAGLPFAALSFAGERLTPAEPIPFALAIAAGAVFAASGRLLGPRPATGALLAALATLATLGLARAGLAAAPSASLGTLIGGTSFGLLLRARAGATPLTWTWSAGLVRGALGGALGLYLLVSASGRSGTVAAVVGVGLSLAIALVVLARFVASAPRTRWGMLATFTAVTLVVVYAAQGRPWDQLSAFVLLLLGGLWSTRDPRRTEAGLGELWSSLTEHPERLFVLTFVFLCSLVTLLLLLPQSAAPGRTVTLIDAAFTAVSAVCVTGLTVYDTPVHFSRFGQVVIALGIQVGGLGIMTFSTAAMRLFGQRMSLRHEGAIASLLSSADRRGVFLSVGRILTFTFGVEAIGAAILFYRFLLYDDSVARAAWRAVFTAISAFCNAGFALQSDNLVPFAASPLVLHTVGALIVLGGLSPVAVLSVAGWARRRPGGVSLQSRLGLVTSAALLGLGFVAFLALEWGQTLAHLSIADRLHNAWFQSVTLRTAGFNSVDFAQLRPATLPITMVLMFIGGSPGGTAGGVKTTAFAVLVLAVVHAVRGSPELQAFGWRLGQRTIQRTIVVITLAVTTLTLAIVMLALTQSMPLELLAFEAVSALGTVGLTIGATGRLDEVGKVIIMTCMFVGRVGGLTMLLFLSQRHLPPRLGAPEAEVDVG